MKVALLTREFPPEVYGGAGVHVEYLSRELAKLVDVGVHCFGAPRPGATTFLPWEQLPAEREGGVLRTMSVDLAMAAAVGGADLAHSHTWYTNLGGHLAKLLYDIPHVMTSHSLEPLRPWKADQLGGGYAVSSFCEATSIVGADAVIAVSSAMRTDILEVYPGVDPERVQVIHNGIDPDEYRPGGREDVARRFGIDPARPSVMFVGRITAQKGIDHLLDAAEHLDPRAQLILCAGAPDTAAIGDAVRARFTSLSERREGVSWIEEMLPRRDVIGLLGVATVFVCPSVYEPFGLINLEAMACEVPVVATAVGGIPEIVVDGSTGYLVPLGPGVGMELAARINDLLGDPVLARAFGRAGRQRVLERFSWGAIAERTAALYASLVRAR